MKKIELKTGIIWLTYSILFINIVYLLSGDTIQLLPLDIRYSFSENRNALWMFLAGWLIGTIFCLYAIVVSKESIWFKWDIRIGKKCFSFGDLQFFYRHINKVMKWGLIFCGILVGSFWILSGEETTNQAWEEYTITHAMGEIDNITYTNCLEAFEKHYQNGNRVFEVDFCFTSDMQMVCRHDWELDYQKGIDAENIPTEEIFDNTLILEKYTPLTLKDLILLMKEYQDIYIVTDTKFGGDEVLLQFATLCDLAREYEAEDVLDRFIVQIYNDEMLEMVKNNYDFPTVIYTLYQTWDGNVDNFLRYCRFCKNNDIKYITMWASLATPEVLEIANAFDITIYVHTVNDLQVAEELIQSGVRGVYTDELYPDMFFQED